jgi:hypothetical protein
MASVFSVINQDGSPTSPFTFTNAYIDLVYSSTYHDSAGHVYWDNLTTLQQQTCIVRATHYIDKRFGHRFRGRKLTREQSLQWPRANAFDNSQWLYSDIDAIPRKLKMAVAEYALRAAILGELAPDAVPFVNPQSFAQDTVPANTIFNGGIVARSIEKVETLEEENIFVKPTEMDKASRNKMPSSTTVADILIPAYPEADMLLEELVQNRSFRLVRGA